MKKIIMSLLVASIVLMTFNTQINAMGIMLIGEEMTDEYAVIVNNEKLVLDEYTVEPYLKDDILMLPLRSIVENIGFNVEWVQLTKSIQISKNEINIEIQISNPEVLVNNESKVVLAVAPEIHGNRTFVSEQFYREVMNLIIVAEGKTLTIEGAHDYKVIVIEESIHGIVADVPQDYMEDEFYQYSHQIVTSPIEGDNNVIEIIGSNHSDDMYMGFYTKIDNLEPNKEYIFKVQFDLGTNAAKDMFGVGGSPGSSVYVKAGLTAIQPNVAMVNDFYLLENVDKGYQSQSGQDMRVIGNLEKTSDDYTDSYEYKSFASYFISTTNDVGEIFLNIGTDSGYEGLTKVYYDNIALIIREASEYNLSTLKETDLQVQMISEELEDGTYIATPKVSGMISYESEVALNGILADIVDTIIDERPISQMYFSSSIKDSGLLSIAFTIGETFGEEILYSKEVFNIDIKNIDLISNNELTLNESELIKVINEEVEKSGYMSIKSLQEFEIFYEAGLYIVIIEVQGSQVMIFIDEAIIESYMRY